MSKLLLQLKQAQALREQQAKDAAEPADPSPAPSKNPSEAPPRRFPVAAAALALVIFVGVVGAWRAAPWKVPPGKYRIDPSALKLDNRLDITRLRQTTPQ